MREEEEEEGRKGGEEEEGRKGGERMASRVQEREKEKKEIDKR